MDAPPTPLSAATTVVRLLQERGHVAYFAGGCVRDTLLGLAPKDYDVATDARPAQVAAIFRHTQFVGEAFGVTLVRLQRQSIEVATFRQESGYLDGRRPSQVAFCDARQDAQRRDFTLNGLFYDPLTTDPDQAIIDHVDGRADLRQGLIRAIGRPQDRFAEDDLRMLRAVRFAARFGFVIEPVTAQAILTHAAHLGRISRERIGQEIAAMLQPQAKLPGTFQPAGPRGMTEAARLMQALTLDGPSLMEDCRQAPLPTLASLDAAASPAIDHAAALTAWLLDRHAPASPQATSADDGATLRAFLQHDTPAIVSRWRKALTLSNAVQDAITATLQGIHRAMDWPAMPLAARRRLLAQPAWPRVRALWQAMAHRPAAAPLLALLEGDLPAILALGDPAPPRLITGGDLIQLGQKPGPAFGRLLEEAYDRQLEGELLHHDQAALWLRRRLADGLDHPAP